MDMICLKDKFMQAPENLVGFSIVVPAIPPALNDSSVVAVDKNVAICCRESIKGVDEELKTNCLGPANVALCSSHGFPLWV